jgi:hypothetical protein
MDLFISAAREARFTTKPPVFGVALGSERNPTKTLGNEKCHENCFLCWPAGAPKKVGVEQEKAGRIRISFANAPIRPPNQFANETWHLRPDAPLYTTRHLFLISDPDRPCINTGLVTL